MAYGNIVENAYQHLRQHNLVQSQYEFSRNWLHRSAGYYGYLKSSGSEPTAGTVLLLLNECGQRKRFWEDTAQSVRLSTLARNVFKKQAAITGNVYESVWGQLFFPRPTGCLNINRTTNDAGCRENIN